ncbi:MAG: hypothetical protein AAF211_16100 [Myxococcota bacterium]
MLNVGLLTLLACGTSAPEPSEPAPAPAPAAAVPEAPQEAPPITRRGKVIEAIEAETYTYARLDYCGQEAWVAGPKTVLEAGKIVKMPEGIVMTDFESKALGRTLETLLMVDWFEVTDETAIDCPTPASAVVRTQKDEPAPAVHGKLLETMQSGGYSYARVEQCGAEKWLAGPQSPLKVGQWIQVFEVAEMRGFQSKTLDRTFDSLLFVPRYKIVPEGPECE